MLPNNKRLRIGSNNTGRTEALRGSATEKSMNENDHEGLPLGALGGETAQTRFERVVAAQFEPNGALSGATDSFVSRPGQIAFAREVARCIERTGTLVAEAGTGTGKTFAYMTPALLSSRKVIVSTAGKALQDQLFNKDIPAVQRALGNHVQVALLKGRANYLCLHRLQQCEEGSVSLPNRLAVEHLREIRKFAKLTEDGDCTRIRGVPEDSPAWRYVTSTKENCIGKRCAFAEECYVMKARARARQADIVVVNHHLFLSAVVDDIPDDARLLPSADVVIFDEAHKLPEIASNFFGNELSTYSIREVVQEVRRVLLSKFKSYADKGLQEWEEMTSAVNNAVQNLLLDIDGLGVLEGDSRNILEIENVNKLVEPLTHLETALSGLIEAIAPLKEINDDLAQHSEVMLAIDAELKNWIKVLENTGKNIDEKNPTVHWIARGKLDARFNETPLLIARYFAALREQQSNASWIFTSATLATGQDDFTHFVNEMGLAGAVTRAWPSPFDYRHQAMLYVPQNMPGPKACGKNQYIDALMAECWPVIDMLAGRTFILCTSYEAMGLAAAQLRDYIDENDRDFTVFVQGEDSRAHILEKFRTTPNAILIATMSFWEGIDIKGERLSLVVIDKLPFAPQNDPVLAARCRWMEQKGINSFMAHQIPLAAIALKQGAGRLIRSETDRGILIVGDNRIIPTTARYAQKFLDSLPEFVRTRKLQRVLDFWRYPERSS